MLFCFFFSSRRRHTRSLCDWSSDVCSSDLNNPVNNGGYYDCSNTHSKPKCSRTHTHAAPTHSRERPCHQRNTGHDYSDNQPYECIANCTKLQSGAWSNAFECSHRVPPSKLD